MLKFFLLIWFITGLLGHEIFHDPVLPEPSTLNSRDENVQIFESCKLKPKQKKFDVLPGRGWDNLQNIEMGRILALNFSDCQFSQDNIYLLPNQVSLIPVKSSNVELYSQLITHFHNYTSNTALSINVGGSFTHGPFSASASFSYEKQRAKNFQLQTKSLLSKVDLRYKIFQSIIEPDAPLDPVFKRRILDIAAVLIEGGDQLYPKYLADLIIRDFGTHVIRTQDAGALLSKMDALNKEYVKKYEGQSSKISVSASGSFLKSFGVGINTSVTNKASEEKVDEYNNNCDKTHIDTHGGELFKAEFTLNDWEKSVMDNLVVIDRNGDPIYYVLTSGALPELNSKLIKQIYDLLKEAVHRYYEKNIVRGCMNINSPNFNEDANIDSEECDDPKLHFSFGGVFQTCSHGVVHELCYGIQQINPLTGDYSCPKGFNAVKLEEGIYKCKKYCINYKVFWEKCAILCGKYATYWCAPNKEGKKIGDGYQFGGFLDENTKTCPRGFIQLKFGLTSNMCVTAEKEYNPKAISFGGFYSCNIGNPLTETAIDNKSLQKGLKSSTNDSIYWPKHCAKGYVAHILTIERDCQISYCTKTNSVSNGATASVHRPPFIEFNFIPNITKPILFQTYDGRKYIKDDTGNWIDVSKHDNKNLPIILGSVFGTLLFALVLSSFVVFYQRRYYKNKIASNSNGDSDLFITIPSNTYGAIDETPSNV